jgi:hypothetical protein
LGERRGCSSRGGRWGVNAGNARDQPVTLRATNPLSSPRWMRDLPGDPVGAGGGSSATEAARLERRGELRRRGRRRRQWRRRRRPEIGASIRGLYAMPPVRGEFDALGLLFDHPGPTAPRFGLDLRERAGPEDSGARRIIWVVADRDRVALGSHKDVGVLLDRWEMHQAVLVLHGGPSPLQYP